MIITKLIWGKCVVFEIFIVLFELAMSRTTDQVFFRICLYVYEIYFIQALLLFSFYFIILFIPCLCYTVHSMFVLYCSFHVCVILFIPCLCYTVHFMFVLYCSFHVCVILFIPCLCYTVHSMFVLYCSFHVCVTLFKILCKRKGNKEYISCFQCFCFFLKTQKNDSSNVDKHTK